MMARSTLDPESFQEILASAFVVQQSLMDIPLPSAMLTVRHLIAAGSIDVNGAMHVITGRARNIAHATGAVIGLLKGDQLIYRAGSGSAATYIGRPTTAILSVSAKSEPKSEILRVEDAETDTGIGGAICHQFGVKSLLILPIYDEQVLQGVLQVFFNEAHAFQDGEVRAYQSMASVVGGMMTHATKVEPKKPVALELSALPTIEQRTPPMQRFPSNSESPANSYATLQAGGLAIAESEKLLSSRARPAAAMTTYRAQRLPIHIRMWKVADRAAVVIVLVTASWIASSYRRPALPLRVVELPRSNTVDQQAPLVPTELGSPNKDMSTPQTASVPMNDLRTAARSTPRRVRVGHDEIDYISEDVIVRHFTRKPVLQRVPPWDDQVEYFSEDVTVRRFAPKLAVPPKQSVDHSAAVGPQ
jgi:hypothetical protein